MTRRRLASRRRRVGLGGREHQLGERGHRVPERDAVALHGLGPPARVLVAVRRRDDDGAAHGEKAEEVEDREVEAE